MTNPAITPSQRIIGDFAPDKSGIPASKSVEERVQKLLDKALYANGRPSAQKIRNFLNGTWLGEPLHVVLTDVPLGAWTVAITFDALDLIGNRREFSLAAKRRCYCAFYNLAYLAKAKVAHRWSGLRRTRLWPPVIISSSRWKDGVRAESRR